MSISIPIAYMQAKEVANSGVQQYFEIRSRTINKLRQTKNNADFFQSMNT